MAHSQCSGATGAARVLITNTFDVPDTDDADADTNDDAGLCEVIVVLAKTHIGVSEDTYCGSDDDEVLVPTGCCSHKFLFIWITLSISGSGSRAPGRMWMYQASSSLTFVGRLVR